MINNNDSNIILSGNIITPYKLLKDNAIFINKGKIAAVKDRKNIMSTDNKKIFDAGDGFIVPGFIDMHVHGGGGYDVMDGSCKAVIEVAKIHSRFGTTAFLPTTMTVSIDKIIRGLSSIKEAFEKGTGAAEVLGIHLEGPYINPLKKGAQKEEDIKIASIEEFTELNLASGKNIRIVTLAPEIPGAIDFIKLLKKQGIITSVGHSNATYEQIKEGINAGISQATHTFNAMSSFGHREPGVAGAVLSSPDLTAEIITDLIHVHPEVLKVLLKVKGIEKIVLVTDAIRATSKTDGVYKLGGQEVIVKNGQARPKNGTLAGSVLTMDTAIRNMTNIVGASLMDAIRMATINPARCLGIEKKKGSLEPGKDADIVILDKNLEVDMTMVNGRIVYNAHPF